LSWLKDDGIVALAHDPGSELLYGLQSEGGGTAATTVLQFNAKGALLAKTRLSNPIPVGRYPFPLAQITWADERLICIVTSSAEDLDAGGSAGGRTYLIEPLSGECRSVRSGNAAARNALQALQGSWDVVSATMNGKAARDASLLEGHWTFKGNELNLQSPKEGTARFTLKLDAKAQPNAFQLMPVEPAVEASGWMLYSREGEKLKVAFYDNLQGRPESFEPRSPRSEPELIVVTLIPRK